MRRTPDPPGPDLRLIDADTGAGTARALQRDLAAELVWGRSSGLRPSVVGLKVEPVAEVRRLEGDAAAEPLMKAVVDVVPFLVRARDRIYRLGHDELALLMPATDGQGVEAVLTRLIHEVPTVLQRRGLGPVRLRPHRLTQASVVDSATG